MWQTEHAYWVSTRCICTLQWDLVGIHTGKWPSERLNLLHPPRIDCSVAFSGKHVPLLASRYVPGGKEASAEPFGLPGVVMWALSFYSVSLSFLSTKLLPYFFSKKELVTSNTVGSHEKKYLDNKKLNSLKVLVFSKFPARKRIKLGE